MEVLLAGIVLQVLGGMTAFALSRWPRLATAFGATTAMAGALLGLAPAISVLLGGVPESLAFRWDPAHGPFQVELDALSAAFLTPVLGLTFLSAVYGSNYLLASRDRKSLGPPWFFFNTFVAGMALALVASTALLFLVAWEVMSVAAYFLVTFEHEDADVRRAGWVYLVATHLGVAFLLAAFVLLGRQAGSLDFAAFRSAPASGGAGAVFVLALVGFGAKAGFVPFHVWLPEAHPAAPSHVSALMSGVMIKLGLYGLLRTLTFLGHPSPWWGLTLAGLGMLTALIGIALALQQRDIKRVLAYSSIENMGLIALSLGVSLWAQATQRPLLAGLALAAALLHIWNHALMKGLMFLAAGSIVHGAGTRELERLGGLMKRMPWTGAILVVGAVAIAALPPLNGFTSKWLIYQALLQCGLSPTGDHGLSALLAVGLLALIGGFAAVTFVRLCGIALLGSPRSHAAAHAHESSAWMLAPMLVLLALCLAMAVVPESGLNLLSAPYGQLLGVPGPSDLSGREALRHAGEALRPVGMLNLGLAGAGALSILLAIARSRKSVRIESPTWGCGYVQPTERMQYTARSFSELLSDYLLPRFLRPRKTRAAPAGLFPSPGRFASWSPDPLSERVYDPFFTRWARRFVELRFLQQGQVNIYLTYIVITLVMALAWTSFRAWWGWTG